MGEGPSRHEFDAHVKRFEAKVREIDGFGDGISEPGLKGGVRTALGLGIKVDEKVDALEGKHDKLREDFDDLKSEYSTDKATAEGEEKAEEKANNRVLGWMNANRGIAGSVGIGVPAIATAVGLALPDDDPAAIVSDHTDEDGDIDKDAYLRELGVELIELLSEGSGQ